MKRSNKATAYILVKANSNNDWENCGFAIIPIHSRRKCGRQAFKSKHLNGIKMRVTDFNIHSKIGKL